MRRVVIVLVAVLGALVVAPPAPATFPGSNGRIAFFDYAGLQIYSIDPDGSGRTQLTSGDQANQYPAWSADGSTIAYVRSRGLEAGRHSIMTMNADGTNKTVVFRAKDARKEILGPAWSPDGSQIVFCAEGRRPPALFVVGADGSGLDQDHARTPSRLSSLVVARRQLDRVRHDQGESFRDRHDGDRWVG